MKEPHFNQPDIWTEDALYHSSAIVRQEAVKEFGEYSSPKSFRILKKFAEQDPRYEVRGLAVLDIKKDVFEDIKLLFFGEDKKLKVSKKSKKLSIKALCEYYTKLKTDKSREQVLSFFEDIFSSQTTDLEIYGFALRMFVGFDFNSKQLKVRPFFYVENVENTFSSFVSKEYLKSLVDRYFELKEKSKENKTEIKKEKMFLRLKEIIESARKDLPKDRVLRYKKILELGFTLEQIVEASGYDISGLKKQGITLKDLLKAKVPLNELNMYFSKKEFLDLGFSEADLR